MNAMVDRLFEEQVRLTPDASALVSPARTAEGQAVTVTYRQLDARANVLAARLREEGIGGGALVAVLMDRSVDLVVAWLGILKAGAAYVPLDPSYPRERLDFMIADTGALLCITQPHLVPLAQATGRRVVVLDGTAELQGNSQLVRGKARESSEAPAYVMYTSGSTGRPKGVVIPHRAIVRLVKSISYARLDNTRVILQLAPTSFDAATFEIWGALLNGGRCVLAPDTGIPDLARLREVIVAFGVTTIWLTASLFNVIVDQAPDMLGTVEEVLTGGEALSVEHIRKAQELLPDVQFINGYGPTESTTFTCCYRIPRPLPAVCRSIPIGSPIANTTVVLLDDDLQEVAPGDPGELCIGGEGLALGYHNRPALTAERFIADPRNPNVGRLYRTGDRVRELSDGTLEFLGRLDQQVKIRGHRVEPGEIEAALRTHVAVENAVVILREDVPGEKRLVAYYTCDGDHQEVTPDALRAHLGATVPEYMVPSCFVALESVPLDPNGKADRRALPAPGRRRPALERPAVAPRSAVERWVAGLWRELLDLDEVGIHDRFFELGGTSVMAMRLLARLSAETKTQLPALILFRAPTVVEMAGILERDYAHALPASVGNGGSKPSVTPTTALAKQAEVRRERLRERRMRRRHAD